MKIRNIMFSGFAAAIFAGVCGAADAASVSLVSQKTFNDAMDTKQNILTAGENIDITGDVISATGLITTERLTEVQTALQTAIDGKQAAGDYAAAGELSTLAGQVDTLAQEVENLKDTSASDAVIKALNDEVDAIAASVKAIQDAPYASEGYVSTAIEAVKDLIPTVPTVVSAFTNDAGYITNAALADYAKSADVSSTYATQTALGEVKATADAAASKTYVDEELAKKQNELQLGENLQWVEGKLDTKGIATADGLAELEAKVNNAAQKTEVATDIADALAEAKQYADDNDADTIYDDTEIKADIAENAAAIQANATAIASKANSADVYTKGEVDTAIAAIEEYDDTVLAGRVSANESAIATNASGIEVNAGAIEALQGKTEGLKALAYKDTVASADIDDKAVTTAKIAGEAAAAGEMMMMTADENGVATWTSVKVY